MKNRDDDRRTAHRENDQATPYRQRHPCRLAGRAVGMPPQQRLQDDGPRLDGHADPDENLAHLGTRLLLGAVGGL